MQSLDEYNDKRESAISISKNKMAILYVNAEVSLQKIQYVS